MGGWIDRYVYIYACNHECKQCALPPAYHHSGFVATNALGHMMYGYTLLVEHCLVHWYQQCVTVHNLLK